MSINRWILFLLLVLPYVNDAKITGQSYEKWINDLTKAVNTLNSAQAYHQQILLEGAYQYARMDKDNVAEVETYLKNEHLLYPEQTLADFIQTFPIQIILINEGKNSGVKSHIEHGGINPGDASFTDYFDQVVSIAGVKVPDGKQVNLLGDNTKLTQLKVADQCATCKTCGNVGGGKNSCGYHAIKNSMYVVRMLDEQTNSQEKVQSLYDQLNNYALVKELFGPGLTKWRSFLQNLVKRDGWDGEFINHDEIEAIIKENGLLKNNAAFNYSVVDRVDNLKAHAKYYTDIQEKFKQPDYRHAFIMGTMTQQSEKGHWFVVVVNKQGNTFEYIIMDSKNSIRLYDPIVKELIKFVQHDKKELIEKVFNALRTAVSGKFYEDNLKKLSLYEKDPLKKVELLKRASKLVEQFKQLGGDTKEIQKIEGRIAAAAVIN